MSNKPSAYSHEDNQSQSSRSARSRSIASSQERKIGDSVSGKYGDSVSGKTGGSRGISKISETITVQPNCEHEPDTCFLCEYGIPYSKCISCENLAHNRCIEAFFCTVGRKVDLNNWKCPKCVTITNLAPDAKNDSGSADNSIATVSKKGSLRPSLDDGDVEVEVKETTLSNTSRSTSAKTPTPGCLFCNIDMEVKNCRCQSCVDSLKESISQKCSCGEGSISRSLRNNRCLHYRDFSSNYYYLNSGVGKGETCGSVQSCTTIATECEDGDDYWVRVCWSIGWFLLLITFAFPIAVICAPIFIILYLFESCCKGCHPICCFFLEGVKLPGTCGYGICTGKPMCSSRNDCC